MTVITVVVLQNCVDLPNGERDSCREKFVTTTHDRNELTFIKVEEVTDRTEEEDPEAVTAVVIRTEPEVSCSLSAENISQTPRIACLFISLSS
jgi:hypothetical protein